MRSLALVSTRISRSAERAMQHYPRVFVALALALAVGFPAAAFAGHKHAKRRSAPDETVMYGGRMVPAPAWSFPCLTDSGPRTCNQFIWAYGRYDAAAMNGR